MVRHNNMISFAHFHKKWQRNVRVLFNQPMKKKRRNAVRNKKYKQMTPQPAYSLRPIISCPTSRYNSRCRVGRGFSLQELKAAKMNPHYARTIGIAVDYRRKSRSLESLLLNKQRLLAYKSKLIMNIELKKPQVVVDSQKSINTIKFRSVNVCAKLISEEERKFSPYTTLRKARTQQKLVGIKRKKLQEGEDGA